MADKRINRAKKIAALMAREHARIAHEIEQDRKGRKPDVRLSRIPICEWTVKDAVGVMVRLLRTKARDLDEERIKVCIDVIGKGKTDLEDSLRLQDAFDYAASPGGRRGQQSKALSRLLGKKSRKTTLD